MTTTDTASNEIESGPAADRSTEGALTGVSERFLARVGSAPISWGICEVPGWGEQLPSDRVLSEMAGLGLTATELGSVGYLPTDPDALRSLLDTHGLRLTGGFNALALADASRRDEQLAIADRSAEILAAGGAEYFVTCVVSDPDDWARPQLSEDEWQEMFDNIGRVDEVCSRHGLQQVFHVHVDSLVESAEEIQRVVDSTTVSFVLETGHMLIGGFDPLTFARDHAERIGLVHLKDVNMTIASPLNSDDITLMQAVQQGIFPSLGDGDAPIAECVTALESAGYSGWYIIEQDVALTEGLPADGEGPVRDVQRSVAYLRSIASAVPEHH